MTHSHHFHAYDTQAQVKESFKTDDDIPEEKTTAAAPSDSSTDHLDVSDQKGRDRKIGEKLLAQVEAVRRKAQQQRMANRDDAAALDRIAVLTPTVVQNIEESTVVIRHGPAETVKKNEASHNSQLGGSVVSVTPTLGGKSSSCHVVKTLKNRHTAPLPPLGSVGGVLSQKQIAEARQQPKPPKVEAALRERYAAIPDIGDRAYQILLDLGMVGQDS
jgi:hypothetical protein